MRDVFPGYYRPDDQQLEAFWNEGIIALDANVLLSLYRFSPAARDQLFAILEQVAERLWLPNRAALEFERGRLGVIDEQRKQYDRVLTEIEKSKATIVGQIRRRSVIAQAQLTEKLEEQLAPVVEHLQQLREQHPDPIVSGDVLVDEIRDRLAELLVGKVGSESALEQASQEGPARYAAKQPPGYADEAKPEPDRYGDLMIWFELVGQAKAAAKPIMLVTGEQKEDWWMNFSGRNVTARPELVEEMQRLAQMPFYLYGLEAFMTAASERYGIDTSDETIEEAREAAEETANWWTADWDTLKTVDFTPIYDYTTLSNANRVVVGDWGNRPALLTTPAQASALVFDSQVVLTFKPGSVDPRDGRVRATVVTPDGQLTRSRDGASTGSSVGSAFPQQFEPLVDMAPGTYQVAWHDDPLDPNIEPRELAHIDFVVPA